MLKNRKKLKRKYWLPTTLTTHYNDRRYKPFPVSAAVQ
jgi:hypothetical protein